MRRTATERQGQRCYPISFFDPWEGMSIMCCESKKGKKASPRKKSR